MQYNEVPSKQVSLNNVKVITLLHEYRRKWTIAKN